VFLHEAVKFAFAYSLQAERQDGRNEKITEKDDKIIWKE
jgi:hypothetical protein